MKKIFIMAAVLLNLFQGCKGQSQPLKIGDPVPVFSLRDQNDSLFQSSACAGKKLLVIFFYPKDESSICTKEACSFRDHYKDFVHAGAMVVGINGGSVESHRSFILNHQLPYTLLSDPENRVLKQFGVKKKFFISGRETFVIDLSGKVAFIYRSMTNGTGHEKEALSFIKTIQAKTP